MASQSHDVAAELFECNSNNQKLVSVCIYGGVPKHVQKSELKQSGLEVVVATPGRLLDLIEEHAVSLQYIEYLVLDEADRMLDEGFEPAIRRIISFCPLNVTRQTVMFSATWPEEIRKLADSFLRPNVVRIVVSRFSLLINQIYDCDLKKKNNVLFSKI